MLVKHAQASLLVVVLLQQDVISNTGSVLLVVEHAAPASQAYPGPTNTAGQRTYEGSG